MKVKTLLPVIVVVVLRIKTIESSQAFKAVERLHQIGGSSASTKLSVKLHFFYQCRAKNMTQNNTLLCFLLLVKYLKVGSQEVEHARGQTVCFRWVVCGRQPGQSTTCRVRGFGFAVAGLPSSSARQDFLLMEWMYTNFTELI